MNNAAGAWRKAKDKFPKFSTSQWCRIDEIGKAVLMCDVEGKRFWCYDEIEDKVVEFELDRIEWLDEEAESGDAKKYTLQDLHNVWDAAKGGNYETRSGRSFYNEKHKKFDDFFKNYKSSEEAEQPKEDSEQKVCGYTCGCTSPEQCQFSHPPKKEDVRPGEWKIYIYTSPLAVTGDYMSEYGITNGKVNFICDKPADIENYELQEICDKLNNTKEQGISDESIEAMAEKDVKWLPVEPKEGDEPIDTQMRQLQMSLYESFVRSGYKQGYKAAIKSQPDKIREEVSALKSTIKTYGELNARLCNDVVKEKDKIRMAIDECNNKTYLNDNLPLEKRMWNKALAHMKQFLESIKDK